MRTASMLVQAQLALGGLTAKDSVTPVLLPIMPRGADDFISGALDVALYRLRCAEGVRGPTPGVGGIRALDAAGSTSRLAGSRKLFLYAYLTQTNPAPLFVFGEPIGVYTIDYMLFTNASHKDEVVYKIVDTLR